MKFIHGLIHDYGQFVVKVHGLFNVGNQTLLTSSEAETLLV